VTRFVDGLFESKTDLPTFKNHIRDFLVQSKEFSAQVIIIYHIPLLQIVIG
jgi:exportin-1